MLIEQQLKTLHSKINNNTLELSKSQPIVVMKPVMMLAGFKPYPDAKIFTESFEPYPDGSLQQELSSFDPFKHYIDKSKHTDCLEKVYLKRYRYHDLVANNELLDKIKANYRIVLLDASADFILNVFPKIGPNNTDDNIDFLSYPIQCLLFYKDDLTYFCALPALLDEAFIPVLHVTVDQIKQILAPLPLLRYDTSQYMLPLLSYNNKNYSVSFTDNDCSIDSSMKLLEHKDQLYSILHGSGFNCFRDLISKYVKKCTNYFDKHLQINFTSNGKVDVKLTGKSNPFWDSFFKNNNFNYLIDNQNIKYKPNIMWSSLLFSKIPKRLCEILNLSDNNVITQEENIPVTEQTIFEPIFHQKGLEQLYTAIGYGCEHKFYFENGQLMTVFGNKYLKYIETGDLDD